MPEVMKYSRTSSKGFTLVELVVTIAVLAIIIAIVVTAINPAEQVARARDAKRIADLSAMSTAWNLYLSQSVASIPDLSGHVSYTCKGEQGSSDTYFIGRAQSTSTPTGFDRVGTSTSQTVGASGWAPARLDLGAGGANMTFLPVDPLSVETTEEFWYAYACDQSTKKYEFTARLESAFFNIELKSISRDGGNSSTTYETGTDLSLIPSGY